MSQEEEEESINQAKRKAAAPTDHHHWRPQASSGGACRMSPIIVAVSSFPTSAAQRNPDQKSPEVQEVPCARGRPPLMLPLELLVSLLRASARATTVGRYLFEKDFQPTATVAQFPPERN